MELPFALPSLSLLSAGSNKLKRRLLCRHCALGDTINQQERMLASAAAAAAAAAVCLLSSPHTQLGCLLGDRSSFCESLIGTAAAAAVVFVVVVVVVVVVAN